MTARVRWKAAVESILLVTLLSFLNAPAAEPVPSSSVVVQLGPAPAAITAW